MKTRLDNAMLRTLRIQKELGRTSTVEVVNSDTEAIADSCKARLDRLFGTNLPTSPYRFTRRLIGSSSTNILDFEDSQATPYAPPVGSPFTLTTPVGSIAESQTHRSFLRMYNLSAAQQNIQWASATAKTIIRIGFGFAINQQFLTTVDTLYGGVRLWGVQAPGAADPYWETRFIYRADERGVHISSWYGTGITYAIGDGTRSGDETLMTPGMQYQLYQLVAAGPAYYPTLYAADGCEGIINSFAQAGNPTSIKCALLYLPGSAYQMVNMDYFAVA